MKNSKLPAGLENQDVETYVYNNELKATYNGTIIPFIELPRKLKEVFEVELIKDRVAFDSLRQDFGLSDGDDMLEQFVKCRFGGFDCHPDLQAGKLNTTPEYWDCGRRGQCPAEGKVCHLPSGDYGRLTPREVQLVRFIAAGLQDKEIAQEMSIEVSTVVTYGKRVRDKIGANNRIEIMNFAIKNNLV